MSMTDKDLTNIMAGLQQYLETEKIFVKNPDRFADVQRAAKIASELFKDATVAIDDDPLQMGALIIRIDGYDVTIRGKVEINLFTEMISKADNFEIYPVDNERVRFAILFSHALTKLP